MPGADADADADGTERADGTDTDTDADTADDAGAADGEAVSRSRLLSDGLRLSISTLTIVRAGAPRADPATVRVAMTAAPAVGLGVGAVAAGVAQLAHWLTGSPVIAAVVAVAAMAAQTRALHLDGLADTADGLGSNQPAEQALAVMKRSDVGPFGVVALVLVLAVQISALAADYFVHRGAIALLAAGMTGRLAITAGCTRPVPAARPGGLGMWVAGSVRVPAAVLAGLAVTAACAALGLIVDPRTAVLAAAAVPLGVAAALLLLARCVVRFGGITGDVLGALVETAGSVAMLVLAVKL
ncbi:adenosylcobinamide-GDP ribazoletransferase [Actinocrinis puniceicyclus]|uniref:Adenosylcobinamide-GDP ribazoletransferase n=1 Tax=Actinocrinis puniceicyclus TaxID=977794 RepID=A0A8J8BCU6_9ACTN|nr:adenosylcobinamide-GDP ribazoletransferase [Actinocrinis puniceicyclus]MBS2963471.1 adenosylcobinamide-GDP ribazoletransferase [Actinocrinis puniceicyclus]